MDKNVIKYNAYMDKQSGEIVCTQLNCNYSIQVHDMAQNMSAIYINTSPNPQSQIEFYANNSTNTASTTYSNCNLSINENNFFLYNMNGGTIWNTDLLTNVLTFYMPIDIANTLTVNNINVNSTLTVNIATVTTTLTCNTIVPTANVTGTLGTSDLFYNTLYVAHGYIDFINTLVYMSNMGLVFMTLYMY